MGLGIALIGAAATLIVLMVVLDSQLGEFSWDWDVEQTGIIVAIVAAAIVFLILLVI